MTPTTEATAHHDVDRRTKAIVGGGIAASNIVGAGVVLVLSGWVLPLRSLVSDQQRALSGNLGLFAVYLVVALLVGVFWGRAWVRVPRAPDRKSTRLNSSHSGESRMPSSA